MAAAATAGWDSCMRACKQEDRLPGSHASQDCHGPMGKWAGSGAKVGRGSKGVGHVQMPLGAQHSTAQHSAAQNQSKSSFLGCWAGGNLGPAVRASVPPLVVVACGSGSGNIRGLPA